MTGWGGPENKERSREGGGKDREKRRDSRHAGKGWEPRKTGGYVPASALYDGKRRGVEGQKESLKKAHLDQDEEMRKGSLKDAEPASRRPISLPYFKRGQGSQETQRER